MNQNSCFKIWKMLETQRKHQTVNGWKVPQLIQWTICWVELVYGQTTGKYLPLFHDVENTGRFKQFVCVCSSWETSRATVPQKVRAWSSWILIPVMIFKRDTGSLLLKTWSWLISPSRPIPPDVPARCRRCSFSVWAVTAGRVAERHELLWTPRTRGTRRSGGADRGTEPRLKLILIRMNQWIKNENYLTTTTRFLWVYFRVKVLASLLPWKSGWFCLGSASRSSRGVIAAVFTLGSTCQIGQLISHWGVWGDLRDRRPDRDTSQPSETFIHMQETRLNSRSHLRTLTVSRFTEFLWLK